jgi:alpha/beta superfamily hydrolase
MNSGLAVETGTLETGDGVQLAAEWAVPSSPVAVAVLAHPHPEMGGDMTVPVISALFGALPGAEVAAIRFDFRGGGRSGGTHTGGEAEALDVVTAIDRITAVAPGVPVWLVGWSFGAGISQQVIDERVAGWVLIAPALVMTPPEWRQASTDPRPKVLLVPEHDQFCPPDCVASETDGWTSVTTTVLSGTDHFLAGQIDTIVNTTIAAITSAP